MTAGLHAAKGNQMTDLSFKPGKHGFGKYKKDRCRCDVCVGANKMYQEKRRMKRREGKIDATPLIDLLYDKMETHSSLGKRFRIWRLTGVDVYTADKICCELGYHPYEVFGDSWWKGASDE